MFNVEPVEDIELARLKNSKDFLVSYKPGIELIKKSGIINFLRIFSRPFSNDGGANIYKAAYNAAFTEGYNKCLDDIVYFEEQYLTEKHGARPVQANFGALQLAKAKGDLTEQEIKNGK